MATEDGTSIEYAGVSTNFDSGKLLEFESNEPHVVTASGPIYAYQVLVSAFSGPNQARTGDPALFAIPAVEQYQFSYVLYTPDTFPNNFIHVTAPDGMTLTIDGESQSVACGGDVAGTIDGTDYCCLPLEIDQGVHEITGSDAFGVYSTGFDEFASYGYTGGVGLQSISSGCTSGGPYRIASCAVPASTTLSASASCPDGSSPSTFWSTPDIVPLFEDVNDLSTTVTSDAFGVFTVCLDVVCGSASTQCCSSIDTMQMSNDGTECP